MYNNSIKKLAQTVLMIMLMPCTLKAETDLEGQTDSISVQERVYDRPFITGKHGALNLGGYMEALASYAITDGVPEGFSQEFRRFNIFFYSKINSRISFLSELEFEHGTEEIALEAAHLDIEFWPELKFRAGIIVIPIGGFNVNHDAPLWNFVDRPLASTRIIPATWSDVGVGFHGKRYLRNWFYTYDLYMVNGLRDGVVSNSSGFTDLPSGSSSGFFEEDNNGRPAWVYRGAIGRHDLGEVGLSAFSGTYNTFKNEGLKVDEPRRADLVAMDAETQMGKWELRVEGVQAWVQVPDNLSGLYAQVQRGFFVDMLRPIGRPWWTAWPESKLQAGLRLEWVDLHAQPASDLEQPGHEIRAIIPGISWRPVPNTVVRFNYRVQQEWDVLGNGPSNTESIQLGFSTYF